MNADTIAAEKLTDDEYIRILSERREHHLRCAETIASTIGYLKDFRDAYERTGSYVTDAAAEREPDRIPTFILGPNGDGTNPSDDGASDETEERVAA